MRPLKIDGKLVHQIAMPFHWGYQEPYPGDSANDLGALSGDPNVSIQESKAFTCEVRAGRRRRRRAPARGHRAERPPGANEDDLDAEHPKERLR